jgi:mannosyl-3-phosphoglycerate phosphatase
MGSNIIFTDLDGTFIDFETYSPDEATPMAREVADRGVPIVFCSSKTLAEQRALMDTIGLSLPCIVENGAGIYLPETIHILEHMTATKCASGGRLITLGKRSEYIKLQVRAVSDALDLDLKPYHKFSDSELSRITGLDEDGARRARKRDFSETLTATLEPEIWNEVNAALQPLGLHCLSGGRFYTVTSIDCNKGRALRIVVDGYESMTGGRWHSIGIGDSANDFDMLESVDHPYLVQTPTGNWNAIDVPNLKRLAAIGPKGWTLAVQDALGLASV